MQSCFSLPKHQSNVALQDPFSEPAGPLDQYISQGNFALHPADTDSPAAGRPVSAGPAGSGGTAAGGAALTPAGKQSAPQGSVGAPGSRQPPSLQDGSGNPLLSGRYGAPGMQSGAAGGPLHGRVGRGGATMVPHHQKDGDARDEAWHAEDSLLGDLTAGDIQEGQPPRPLRSNAVRVSMHAWAVVHSGLSRRACRQQLSACHAGAVLAGRHTQQHGSPGCGEGAGAGADQGRAGRHAAAEAGPGAAALPAPSPHLPLQPLARPARHQGTPAPAPTLPPL